MRDASLLLPAGSYGRKCVWAYDGKIQAARRLRLDEVPGEVRVTVQDDVAVLSVVANERLQAVIWSVMYVTHQAMQTFVARSCPLGHFSRAAAYRP